MFRNIFCGCTSNKNGSSELIVLQVEDIVDKEQKSEEEQDSALIEKNEKLNIEKKSVGAPSVDAPSVDAPWVNSPSIDTPSKPTVELFEEDHEIIDILTEKPVENDAGTKSVTRKYLFF